MNIKLAKFKDLIPSSLPFVEGKLDGHKERKNYSILGPGVAEDADQSIKISEPHGFNLGAVSAKPFNGSGLHSHLTAEVFIIYSGKWRFYWGSEGKDETILNPGDIISMPTNMFRAFENAGDEEGLIFVVLGGDDPGIVTWIPEVLERAKKTGMALLDDNSLIDLNIKAIPNGRRLLEPISNDEIKKFNNYKLDQLQSNISTLNNRIENELNIGDNIKISHILGNIFQDKSINPIIKQDTGFSLSCFKSKKGRVENLIFNKPTILFSQKGNWKIEMENLSKEINFKDTISIPLGVNVNIEINESEIKSKYWATKSIVSVRDIKKGEFLSNEMISFMIFWI